MKKLRAIKYLFVGIGVLLAYDNAKAQNCFPPNTLTVTAVTQSSATFQWTSTNVPLTEHCWNIEVGGAGFACGNGTAIQTAVVCQGDAELQVNGQQLTLTIEGLQPGTSYDWTIVETCDGIMPPFNTSGPCTGAQGPTFATFDSPFLVDSDNIQPPTCPLASPGFIANGSFEVVITDATTCPGSTYDIELASGPYALIPVNYLGVPASAYPFFNAGPGTYSFEITENGLCNPQVNPEMLEVIVPDAVDSNAPIWTLTDILGNILADTDPLTAIDDVFDLGTIDLPEGSCAFQQQYYAFGEDECDGIISAADALTVEAMTIPAAIDPGTQAAVTADQFGLYLVDVNWSTGGTTLSLHGTDASDNIATLTITANVQDNINPSITLGGLDNFVIPACTDALTATVEVYIDNGCDQSIVNGLLLGNLEVNFNGTENLLAVEPFDDGAFLQFEVTISIADDGSTWSVVYTDVFGNEAQASALLSVEKATEDQPPVFFAADEVVTLAVCQPSLLVNYSLQLSDDCAPIIPEDIEFDDANSGLALDGFSFSANGQSVQIAVSGGLAPGTYQPVFSYQGVSVSPTITVLEGDPVAPVIQLPGNLNFTIPSCENTLAVKLTVGITDDCDTPVDPAAANFILGGMTLSPDLVYSAGTTTFFEFELNLTALNNGNLLTVSYLDSDGLLAVENATITVTDQADTWAPIIVYPSQDILVDLDACAAAAAVVSFSAKATDNCAGQVPVVATANGLDVVALGGGDFLAMGTPGTYMVQLQAADNSGNVQQEDFQIQIDQEEAPVANFACNDTLNVALNENCEVLTTMDMLIEGSLGCWTEDDFSIVVWDGNPSNGPVADGVGTFNYTFNWQAPPPSNGFENALAATNWTSQTTGAGAVSFSNNLNLSVSSNAAGSAKAWFVFQTDGSLQFSWSGNVGNVQAVGQLRQANGTVLWDIQNNASGSFNADVPAGSIWVLSLIGSEQAQLNISDLSFAPEAEDEPSSCGGVLNLEDKMAPTISCPDDLVIITDEVEFYLSSAGLNVTGFPQVDDNCGPFQIEYDDDITTLGDCGGVIIERTFTATDGAGNTSTCLQTITVDFPSVNNITLPQDTVIVPCNVDYPALPGGNPAPEYTGFPTVETIDGEFPLDPSYANLGATFSDGAAVPFCESSFSFLREWTITDWCNPGSSFIYLQIIKVGDFEGPEVSCPFTGPAIFYTGPFNCTSTFAVPPPVVSDPCSSWEVTAQVITTGANGPVVLATVPPNSGNNFVSNIPAGEHFIRYIVEDNCGNISIEDCPIRVIDAINPVAICKENLNITLSSQGVARIYPEDVDNGSEDNCGIELWQVRRAYAPEVVDCHGVSAGYSPWGDFVEVNCCDAGQLVSIELRVVDAAGNEAICWFTVLVEDKRRPRCFPPVDVQTTCEALPYDFDANDILHLQSLFGIPNVTDNCGASWEELTPLVNLSDCGSGNITRIFRATDNFDNVSDDLCQQQIVIDLISRYKIKFPKDAEAFCGEVMADTIGLEELACDLLALNVNSDTFSLSGDDCFKILRTYRVINWCEYNGASDPLIVDRDEDCDGFNGEEDIWVSVETDGTVYYDRDEDPFNANPSAFLKQPTCDGLTNPNGYWKSSLMDPAISSVGFWQYTQEIKVRDTLAPSMQFLPPDAVCTLSDTSCMAAVEELFLVDENCTPYDLRFNVFIDLQADGSLDEDWSGNEGVVIGVYPKYKVSGFLPIGEHIIEIHVIDGCGNTGVLNMPMEVVDCKAPAPICINGLSTALNVLPDGTDADGDGDIDLAANSIWVSDFLVSAPQVDCSPPVRYSINKVGETPDSDQTAIVLTCDDQQQVIVQVYAWDSADNPYAVQPDGTLGGPNYDFCETYVNIDNINGPVCGINLMIEGRIATEINQFVPEVEVSLNMPPQAQTETDANGDYNFTGLESGQDYTVLPFLDENATLGISTFDLVMITRHILGEAPLNSPYKLIAADIDNSGYISVSDLIQLRELILSIRNEFANNTSWRFIPQAYEFPNPLDPWEEIFPEVINYNNLMGAELEAHFVGVKIGDVTLDALELQNEVVETHALDDAILWLEDQYLEPGKTYDIPVFLKTHCMLNGIQLAIAPLNKSIRVELRPAINENNSYWQSHMAKGGAQLLSWVLSTPLTNEGRDPIFYISLSTESPQWVHDAIELAPHLLKPEIITSENSEQKSAQLQIIPASDNTSLYFAPNPVIDDAFLHMNAQQGGIADLTFYTAAGQIVVQERIEFEKGIQKFVFPDLKRFGANILWYSIRASHFVTNGAIVVQ